MKIDECECVKIKRDAQERIYAETKDMTPDQLVTYYNQIGEALRKHQAALRAKGKTKAS
jgi:hypothetical protein